jgi:hypothetical protein
MFGRLLSLLALVLLFGCRTACKNFGYSGGDGQTVDRAVMIDGARDMNDVTRAEEHWIRLRFRGAIIQRQYLAIDPLTSGRLSPCDRVEFRTTDGETRVVYFQYPFACVPGQPRGTNK